MSSVSVNRIADFEQKIDNRQAHVGIIGMGYVGLPLALLFTEAGFAVTGYDIDSKKVDALNNGR